MYRFFCRRKRLVPLLFICIILIFLNTFNFYNFSQKDEKTSQDGYRVAHTTTQTRLGNITKDEQPLSKWNAAKLDDRQPVKGQNNKTILKRKFRRKSGAFKRKRFPTAADWLQEKETEWKPPSNAGENGEGVEVNKTWLSKEQKRKLEEGFKLNGYNQFVSDFISLHRSLPEVRHPECLSEQYQENLPETSVVIIFYNEPFSTLLRTVHSVLDRSPPHLLRQVILVDDASDMEHLKGPLDDYISRLEKVKVVRMKSRQGLIAARIVGFTQVTTPTVLFLDSHCECAKGWLEPMLDRIAKDPTTVVIPVVDVIDEKTFAFAHDNDEINVNTFSWNLAFDWIPMQPSERLRRKSYIEPVRTPIMVGGLFAIDSDFFTKLGTYDPGMKIWGGENLELSFKIWMCGGTMETIPCSQVGHVFRGDDYEGRSADNFGDYGSLNLDRVALVWMDDYRVYYNKSDKDLKKAGDVSERLKLRHRLKCHSFAWFMKNVLPERDFPADRVVHGPIGNKFTGLCIVAINESIVLKDCTPDETEWYMNANVSDIIKDNDGIKCYCLDYSEDVGFQMNECHGEGGNQLWKYSQDLQQLYHVDSGLCAEATTEKRRSKPQDDDQESFQLLMTQCDPSNPRQQWMWDTSPVPGPSWRKDMAAGIPVV